LTAIVSAISLPPGWKAYVNSDGKKYYANANTGVKSFTPPILPFGWKEVHTPEGRPFFVCDEFQLACWEWPGEQPKVSKGNPVTTGDTHSTANNSAQNPEANPSKMPEATPGTTKEDRPSKKRVRKPSKSTVVEGAAVAGTAVDIAINIAKLSNAANLTPMGILSATKAAAKLTSHGVKFASNRIKNSRLRRAGRLLNTVVVLSGDGDGDPDVDGEYDGEEDFNGNGDNYGDEDLNVNGDFADSGDFNGDGDIIGNGDDQGDDGCVGEDSGTFTAGGDEDTAIVDCDQQDYENDGALYGSSPTGYNDQYQYDQQLQPQVVDSSETISSPALGSNDIAEPITTPVDENSFIYQSDQTSVLTDDAIITETILVVDSQSLYGSTSVQDEVEIDFITVNEVSDDTVDYS
jgi:hypothetical protein